jgi:hypothetical protein
MPAHAVFQLKFLWCNHRFQFWLSCLIIIMRVNIWFTSALFFWCLIGVNVYSFARKRKSLSDLFKLCLKAMKIN